MRTEASWSALSNKPIVLYIKKLDKHIVYLNGLGMAHSEALLLIGTMTMGIFPTPKMKQKTYRDFQTIYKSGGFKTREWDDFTGERLSYLCKKTYPIIEKLLKEYKPWEIFQWFDTRNAVIVED